MRSPSNHAVAISASLVTICPNPANHGVGRAIGKTDRVRRKSCRRNSQPVSHNAKHHLDEALTALQSAGDVSDT